jgi:two-component sensor histidine kinase
LPQYWTIIAAGAAASATIIVIAWALEARSRRYAKALEKLNAVGAGGLQELTAAACQIVGMTRCAVAQLDREAGLRVLTVSGSGPLLGNDFELKDLPLCSSVLSSRQPAFVGDINDNAVVNAEIAKASETRSLALIPLIKNDRRLGLFVFCGITSRRFSSHDRRLCQIIADKAAALLAGGDEHANAEALREQQAMYEKREAIFAVNAAVYRAGTSNEAVQMVVDLAPGVLGVDLCLLSFDNGDGQTMRIAAITKPRASDLIAKVFAHRGTNGEIVRNTRRTLVVENATEHPKVNPAIREELDVGSIVYLPLLRAGGTFMGILSLVRHRSGPFSPEQLNLAEQFAARAAGAIENAELLEQTRRDAQAKTMLLRELNHRVKNNLASIITLLSLDEPEMSPRAHQWLGRAIDRIRTMARTHDLFAGGMDRVTLRDLVGQTISSLSVARPAGIVVKEEIHAPVTLRTDRAVSLAMVLHELCYNAIVHGLAGSHGSVVIRARMKPAEKTADGRVVLEVIDDATAARNSAGADAERIGGGVGLTLVKGLVTRELHGEFNLNRGKEQTVATVSFPVAAEDLPQAA